MKSRVFCNLALSALLLLVSPPGRARADLARPPEFRPLHLLYAGGAGLSSRPAAPAMAPTLASNASSTAAALRVEGGGADEPSGGAKSGKKALLLSMLLPGAGELYLGNKGRAIGFFVAEGGIWANYIAWEISGHLRKNDYIERAQINAGVGIGSASDDYWRLLGQFQRSSGTGPDAYEESLRRDARLQYPDDPNAQDLYVAQRLPTGKSAWSWDTPALQQEYIDTRKNANRAFDRAKISFGVAVLNRLVSAVDTQIIHRSRLARAESSRGEEPTRVLATLTADGGGVLLIQRRF